MGRATCRVVAVALLVAALSGCTGPGRDRSPEPVPVVPEPGTGVAVGSLRLPRAAHSATTLPDGRVLVAGGCTRDGCGGTPEGGRSELFDPGTNRFIDGPVMVHARVGHTATALPDGRVLVAGGWPDEGRPPLAQLEIFDPRSNRFTPAGTLRTGRGGGTATRLADGRVLVVGGTDGRQALATVEIIDPVRGTVTSAAALPAPRDAHSAALLADGRVLVVGGRANVGPDATLLDSAVVYHPTRDAWLAVGRLREAKYKLAIAALPDGHALVVGGQTAPDPAARLATTELFDPATDTFRPGPAMAEARYKNAVVVLRDGRVVIAGGYGVEVYTSGRLTGVTGIPSVERQAFAAAALADGTVLVTGGYDDRTHPAASAVRIRV